MINWSIAISVFVGAMAVIVLLTLIQLFVYAIQTHKFRNAYWRVKAKFQRRLTEEDKTRIENSLLQFSNKPEVER